MIPQAPRLALGLLLASALPLWLASCGEDPAFAAARTCLKQFQQGLRNGDEVLLRRSVTTRSRQFVSKLPQRPEALDLEVREQSRDNSRIYLDVTDPSPNAPVRTGRFVVAKEDGVWLVDLIATAGEGAREVVGEGPARPRFVPKKLSESELRQASRALEASARRKSRH